MSWDQTPQGGACNSYWPFHTAGARATRANSELHWGWQGDESSGYHKAMVTNCTHGASPHMADRRLERRGVCRPTGWVSLQHEIWSHVTNLLDSKVMVKETDMMWEDLPAHRARFPDLLPFCLLSGPRATANGLNHWDVQHELWEKKKWGHDE